MKKKTLDRAVESDEILMGTTNHAQIHSSLDLAFIQRLQKPQ